MPTTELIDGYTITEIRAECEQHGMNGDDLDTALTHWLKSRGVNDSDGARIQAVVSALPTRHAM